jgi:hypothetical protein
MMRKFRAIVVMGLFCSLACGGGERGAPEEDNGDDVAERASSARNSELVEGRDDDSGPLSDRRVIGNLDQAAATEGSNTNWRPNDPRRGHKSEPPIDVKPSSTPAPARPDESDSAPSDSANPDPAGGAMGQGEGNGQGEGDGESL